MLLSAVSFLVVAQSSSKVPEGLMNNPVLFYGKKSYAIELSIMDPGYSSRYSNCVRGSINRGILLRFPSRTRPFPLLQLVLTCSEADNAFCPVVSGVYFRMLQ